MAKPSVQSTPIRYKDDAGVVHVGALIAELRRQATLRNATFPCVLLADLMPLCEAVDDLADVARDAQT